LQPFSGARVGAVTGIALPYELETNAQELFERYGGFNRGTFPKTFDYKTIPPAAAGIVGAGANMAIRRELILRMRLFDKELDAGTVSKTGGDTYAFYRLLADGYRITYNPDALVWHRHRRDHEHLRDTIYGYGVGAYSFMTRCVVEHRDLQALRIGATWFTRHHVGEVVRALLRRPDHLPLDIAVAELRGALRGPRAYFQSRRIERTAP